MSTQDICDAIFLKEDEPEPESKPWRILIVDDENDIHTVTQMALDRYTYQSRTLELLHAYSAEEAMQLLHREQGIAVILLDIVMESDDAGLEVARFLRDKLGNHETQIILRTGLTNPSHEGPDYPKKLCNYYESKNTLTVERLTTTLRRALSSFASTEGNLAC